MNNIPAEFWRILGTGLCMGMFVVSFGVLYAIMLRADKKYE